MRHRTDSGNVQHRCRSRSVYVETHPPSDCVSFVVRGLWHSREDFTTIQKETEPVWKPETHPVSTVCVFCRSAGRFGAGRWRKPKAVVCFERWESAGVRRGQLVHAAELCSSGKVPSGEESSLDIKNDLQWWRTVCVSLPHTYHLLIRHERLIMSVRRKLDSNSNMRKDKAQ